MLQEFQVLLLISPAGPRLAFLQVQAQFRCLLLAKQIQRRVVEPRVFAPGQQEVRLQAYTRDESDTHERACDWSDRLGTSAAEHRQTRIAERLEPYLRDEGIEQPEGEKYLVLDAHCRPVHRQSVHTVTNRALCAIAGDLAHQARQRAPGLKV